MNTLVKPLTLEQYRGMVKPEKELCRYCGTQLPETVSHYPHFDGWPVAGLVDRQWLYLHCVNCEYDWALWKLGVPRA